MKYIHRKELPDMYISSKREKAYPNLLKNILVGKLQYLNSSSPNKHFSQGNDFFISDIKVENLCCVMVAIDKM